MFDLTPEQDAAIHRKLLGDGQPDAWKITDADGGYWFTDKPENPDLFISEIMQTPLYATLPRDPQGLVEALRYYADPDNYLDGMWVRSAVGTDRGKYASAALAAWEAGK